MFQQILLTALSFVALTGMNAAPYMAEHPLTTIAIRAEKRSSPVNLYIHNSEDYIADGSDGSMDILDEFKKYVLATDNVTINVSYSTFSTMEDELSKLQTGGTVADLVCVSDYIIQRLMALNMVVPFKSGAERTALYGGDATGWDDNYSLYASQYLQNELKGIKATINGQEGNLGDYARGYMWGTLGITYNPDFSAYASRGLSREDVMVQMSDWNALWSGNYNQTFQVKDSMRDTYSIGLMHVYDAYFSKLLEWYKAGKDDGGSAYSASQYTSDVSTIFNNINHLDDFNALAKKLDAAAPTYTVKSIVDAVQAALIQLKSDSFGLEVDSGKTDIISGDKSGIDTAWSGDAVTSLNNADELGNTLYYSIPKTGGNIWFDAWVLIKRDGLEQEYAQKFIDFISRPDIAAANMDYIGYTSFIAGDDILELVRGWYDPRYSAMYVYDSANDDYLYDDNGDKVYKDGTGIHKNPDGTDGNDYGEHNMTGSSLAGAVVDQDALIGWDEYAEKYAPDDNTWQAVDLSYFFKGSLSDDTDDCIVYSNEFEEVTGKNLKGEQETVLVGRQFLTQYPSDMEDQKGTVLCQIPGLAVMEDYKTNNSYILFMWENVKSSGAIQPWIVVLLSLEAAAALGFGLYFFFRSRASKVLRKKRREDRQSAEPAKVPQTPASK
jgi:spermidine/putrescine transport system substrate-binding protein